MQPTKTNPTPYSASFCRTPIVLNNKRKSRAVLNLFLRWVDSNTILVNNERFWADAKDCLSEPLTPKEIVEAFYSKKGTKNNQTKVTSRTRAVADGKAVYCPKCNHKEVLYHFNFTAVQCDNCKLMIPKGELNLF